MLGRCTTGPYFARADGLSYRIARWDHAFRRGRQDLNPLIPTFAAKRWAGQDSNLRSPSGRQIYSLVVLATHPPTRDKNRALPVSDATGILAENRAGLSGYRPVMAVGDDGDSGSEFGRD